jgi:hypothetical protein
MEIKRRELKYYINYIDYTYLTSILANLFNKDRYSQKIDGYHVRSIYFDNKENNSYYQKISGIETRKKYRIRIYNLNSDIVRLEIKNKHDNIIIKETLVIRSEDAEKITSGDYTCLLNYTDPVANKIYSEFNKDHYRPVIIIDFVRNACFYDFNDIRITFDRQLKKNEVSVYDIFEKNLEMDPVLSLNKIILEIKYNNILPLWIKNLLQVSRFERCAISKYTLSRFIEG